MALFAINVALATADGLWARAHLGSYDCAHKHRDRDRSRVEHELALRPESSAQTRMPPTARGAPRGERPGPLVLTAGPVSYLYGRHPTGPMLAKSAARDECAGRSSAERKVHRMLVLTRKSNQGIMIGNDVELLVLSITGEKVRFGIQAPRTFGCTVWRPTTRSIARTEKTRLRRTSAPS